MKIRVLLIVFIMGALSLAACKSNSAYPGPGDVYPLPMDEVFPTETPSPTVPVGEALYPDLGDNSAIGWFQAEAMILHGEVGKIVLLKDAQIQLLLKDGRLLISALPAESDVNALIVQCGDLCKETVVEQE